MATAGVTRLKDKSTQVSPGTFKLNLKGDKKWTKNMTKLHPSTIIYILWRSTKNRWPTLHQFVIFHTEPGTNITTLVYSINYIAHKWHSLPVCWLPLGPISTSYDDSPSNDSSLKIEAESVELNSQKISVITLLLTIQQKVSEVFAHYVNKYVDILVKALNSTVNVQGPNH